MSCIRSSRLLRSARICRCRGCTFRRRRLRMRLRPAAIRSNAAVCATEGLLQMLDRDEIAGVMAHELAHVKHRDILITSVAATIGGAISYLGYIFMVRRRSAREGGNPLGGLLVLILGPLAAGLIQAAISRSREFNADKVGAEIWAIRCRSRRRWRRSTPTARQVPLPVNPAMNGLFIAEPFNAMGEGLANMFQTHPPLEKRLMNLIGRESTGQCFSHPAW